MAAGATRPRRSPPSCEALLAKTPVPNPRAPSVRPPSSSSRPGKRPPEIVIALKQLPGLIRSLRSEYDSMVASLTITSASVARMAQALLTPIRDEEHLASIVADLGQRLHGEYQRSYEAGPADANNPGEIVDPTTGERRQLKLKLDGGAAGSKDVRERWGRTNEANGIAYATG
jgi:hypothetical protein